MSSIKWFMIMVMIGMFWLDVLALWVAYTNPWLGVPFVTLVIPLNVCIYKEFLSDWSRA
jgi:hypothetical protein